MSQAFVGRKAELARCRKMAASSQFECLVLYGRRRVGKTYLILELLKDHRGLYFTFEQQSTPVLLEKFSERVLQIFPSAFLSSFTSFEQAFLYLAEQVGTEPFTLALDEFQYIAMQDKTFLSMLQNIIDHHWQKTNLLLILCGSYMSFMESEILGAKSPVFGRRTASLKLEPLRFTEARTMLAAYSNLDAFLAWGIVGGMPLYLKQFDTEVDIRQNILDNILAKGSLLNNEPVFALKQELREPSLYFSILEGISTGKTKYNEITGWIGADAGYYLNHLIALGIVTREMPFGVKDNTRKGIYQLSDPYFTFYFRYISRYLSLVEAEKHDLLWNQVIEPTLSAYLGQRFEALCGEQLDEWNGTENLPFIFSKKGRWWGTNPATRSQEEIDWVASDGADKVLVVECKWKTSQATEQDIHTLMARCTLMPQSDPYQFFFSRKGLSGNASRIAQAHHIRSMTFAEKGDMLWNRE